MSAALVDGPFAWPSEEEQQLQQSGAGGLPAISTQHGGVAQAQVSGSGVQSSSIGSLSLAEMLMDRKQGVVSGRSSTVVPLLDRFQMCVGLEVATAVHPR